MKVRDIMRPARWTVDQNDTLGRAERLMVRHRVRHLFVVASGQLTGILSASDILQYRARTGGDGEWAHAPVRGAMERVKVTVDTDDAVDEVSQRLVSSRFDEVPVVQQGLLVGVVAATDVLEAEAQPIARPEPIVAADAMSEPVVTVAPGDPLLDAVALMVDHGIRHLPVVDQGEIVGILSDRDVRTIVGDPSSFLEPLGGGPRTLTVREAMTRTAITVPSDRPLGQLATQLADEGVGALPVVGPDGRLIGVVSYVDVLRAMSA